MTEAEVEVILGRSHQLRDAGHRRELEKPGASGRVAVLSES